MAGTFGYELDPGKLSEEEKEEVRKQITAFKKYYELIQEGDYFRLTDPARDEHYAAWEFADQEGKEALLSVVAYKGADQRSAVQSASPRSSRGCGLRNERKGISGRGPDAWRFPPCRKRQRSTRAGCSISR